jgi:hypothetical protein
MFEAARLLGPTRRSIALETHLGRSIENEIALEPDETSIRKYQRLLANHPGWKERRSPFGICNCVGHVWASRRTAVYENLDNQVIGVFQDDGYRVLDWPRESLLIGDLVTYWDSAKRHKGFFHVGIVFEIRSLDEGTQQLPWILSKWDDSSGEVLHHYKEVPFSDDIEAEFWTDRALERTGR